MTKSVLFTHTPLGTMTLVETDGKLSELRFSERAEDGERLQSTPLLRKAERELTEYFSGVRKAFSVPLAPRGTPFQRTVWDAAHARFPTARRHRTAILPDRSETRRPREPSAWPTTAIRLPIFIPCHRVIGADGSMVGYGSGLDKKEFLLALESKPAR